MSSFALDELCLNPVDNGNGWDLWPDGQITVNDMTVSIRNTSDSANSMIGLVLETGLQRVFYSGTLSANAATRLYNRIDYGVVLDETPLTVKLWEKSQTPWVLFDQFHVAASAPNSCWQRQANGSWVQKAGPRSAGF